MTSPGEQSRPGASWEEQVVPTLRKRLEHESAYLSNRLSASNFSDISSNSFSSGLGLQTHPSPLQNAFPPSGPSSRLSQGEAQQSDAAARTRTTSNPHLLNKPTYHASGSGAVSSSRKISAPPQSSERPTMIPSRPRSNTNLAGRPKPSRTPSNPIETTSTALRPKRSISPLPSAMRAALDGQNGKMPEAHIKNELPPFMLYPGEAMRIAEHGHDYDSDSFGGMGLENGVSRFGNENWETPEDDSSRRKRSITMRNTASPPNAHKRDRSSRGPTGIPRPSTGSRGIDGMPRSNTGQALGLGQPSARMQPTHKGRAASSNVRGTLNTPSSAPRSASLNILGAPSSAGSSRLGPAAHWIPPESTYTPPKGTDWDDVVIPSVAKKLGMSGTKPAAESFEEGDLAVEWDKDGVPIKWVKRPPRQIATSVRTTPGDVDSSGGFTQSPEEAEWDEHNRVPSGPSSFSPTFEPSPDNPLHQSTTSRITQPTPTPTPQKPVLRAHRSRQEMELSPLRPPPANMYGHEPSSPAPFTSLVPNPALHHAASNSSSSGVSRRPSKLALGGVSPAASRQASHRSMREVYATEENVITGGKGPNRAASFVRAHSSDANPSKPTWESKPRGDASPSSSFGMGPSGDDVHPGLGTRPQNDVHRKKADESHGKGCGCIIM